jgi:hypothetical protein
MVHTQASKGMLGLLVVAELYKRINSAHLRLELVYTHLRVSRHKLTSNLERCCQFEVIVEYQPEEGLIGFLQGLKVRRSLLSIFEGVRDCLDYQTGYRDGKVYTESSAGELSGSTQDSYKAFRFTLLFAVIGDDEPYIRLGPDTGNHFTTEFDVEDLVI